MASTDVNPPAPPPLPPLNHSNPPQHTWTTPGNDPEDDVFTPAEYTAAFRSIDKSQWPSDKLEEEATRVMRSNRTLKETQEAMEGAEDGGPIWKDILEYLSDKVQCMGEAIELQASKLEEKKKFMDKLTSSMHAQRENDRTMFSTLQAGQDAILKGITRTLQRGALQGSQKGKTATPHCETAPLQATGDGGQHQANQEDDTDEAHQ